MLIRAWRDHHRLSLRAAGRILGIGAAALLRIERGDVMPGPDVSSRIYWTTRATGPGPVDASDLIVPWRSRNPAAVKVARGFAAGAKKRLRAELKPKKGLGK